MRALLLAIAGHLTVTLGLPVYACPEDALAASVRLPCLSVADGSLRVRALAGGRREEEIEVIVACHVEPHNAESALSGPDGVLEMAARIRDALEGNLLGLAGMIEAALAEEEASRLHEWRGRTLLSRRSVFRYLREVTP